MRILNADEFLDDAWLTELVRCQTQVDSGPTDNPFPALMPDGSPAIVPDDEEWFLARVMATNCSGSEQDLTVWVNRTLPTPDVPDGLTSSTTTGRWLSAIPVSSGPIEILEPPASSKVLRVLNPGDYISLMGGGTSVNLVILGWRKRV